MAYQVSIDDVTKNIRYDITNAVSQAVINQYRTSQASKLTLQVKKDITIPKGSKVSFQSNEKRYSSAILLQMIEMNGEYQHTHFMIK